MQKFSLSIRLERADDIPAFAGYLRCEAQHQGSHVILMNVQACMAPVVLSEDGTESPMSREDRKRLIISSLMHEFGHALESHFGLPVNEEAIENACMEWEAAWAKAMSEQHADNAEAVRSSAWLESWAWRAARHMRNTDKMPAVQWGVDAIDILAELRDHDPNGYDREVKRFS